MKILSVV